MNKFNRFLNDIKKIDMSEYEEIISTHNKKTFNIYSYIDDKICDVAESISEFGYKNQSGWEHAFNIYKLALKYKYYKRLSSCLSDIWQNSFGVWVEEDLDNPKLELDSVKNYISNVYLLTKKISDWWYQQYVH